MPALALVDLLPDFGAARRSPAAEPAPPSRAQLQELEDRVRAAERERVAEAVANAQAELAERFLQQHAEEIDTLRKGHAAEIEKLRAELGETAGRLVAERLGLLQHEVLGLTSSTVARILGGILTEQVQQAALAELARSILGALADRDAVRIRMSGPLSLYEALRPGLGGFADRVEFTEGEGFDLSASIDNMLFETRMAEWSAALAEVLA
jgi:uncharacterized membrane protein YeaQ/YmgE (transglycosylase-associated protein family)